MKCEECSNDKNLVICIECDEILCKLCDSIIHKGGKRKSHSRPLVCELCRIPAVLMCKTCSILCCSVCKHSHENHLSSPICIPKNLGVFFDISSFTSTHNLCFSEIIKEITARISEPKSVKIYSDN